jgi:outer membrane protein OmpA-like peptidoglycan-associated protein
VKPEYHRELWNLAEEVLSSDDGAVSIRAYASPRLEAEARGRLVNRRCLGAAAMLQQMGVPWRCIRIEDEVGEIEPGPPSWREHRVEFTAIKSLPPDAEVASGDGDADETGEDKQLEVNIAGSDDPLAMLVEDATIYFGGNSADVRTNDEKKLRRIASYLTKDGETRNLAVRAVTDRWGNKDYNRALGRRRQKAVIGVLASAGAPPERLIADKIKSTTADEGGPSWKQRRAELTLR